MMAFHHFIAPEIQDNPNGWGPNSVPEQFKDMPYQPFSKSDRIGKVFSFLPSFQLILTDCLIQTGRWLDWSHVSG